MIHVAYPTAYPLGPGVQVSILVSPIETGDELAIEYPNGEKGSAKVMQGTKKTLEILVAKKRWRLAPLAAATEPQSPMRFLRMPVPVWVVQ